MNLGVFVCHCGMNIARVVDVKDVVDYAKKFVTYAKDLNYACSNSDQEEIASAIKDKKLDAVVVAACSPKLHEATFRRVAIRAGLNPYMVEIANIREQCSWVHSDVRAATDKTRDLVRMAVAKVEKNRPLEKVKIEINKSVAVIGAGVAGIEAALTIADSGYKVYLIEKRPTIGGHMALLNEVFPTNDCSICILAPKMSDVWKHENVTVITNAKVEEVSGSVGNFNIKIKKYPRFVDESKCKGCINDCSSVCPVEVSSEYNFGMGPRKAIYIPFPQSTPLYATIDWENCIGCRLCEKACQPKAVNFEQKVENIEIKVGAIIVATGYKLFDAKKLPELGYGKYQNVITLFELERLLSASGPTKGKLIRPSDFALPKRVAFILCVGSRDEKTNRHCSRVCCMASLKNAYAIKRRYPDVEITVFYIDIRAFGKMYEEFYKRVQESGVRFVRGKVGEVIELEDKSLVISYESTLEGDVRSEVFDLVVLAVGMEGENDVAKMLGIGVGEDGFLDVSHPKLKPAETNVKGIFVAGCASGPKDIQDSVFSAGLAASKALQLIISGETEFDPYFAFVNEEKCIGCKICENVCDFKAVSVNKKAKINPKACTMCGICVASCPVDAIDMGFFNNDGIEAMIEALASEKNVDPVILAFCCWYCGYGAADLAGMMKIEYEPNVRIIRVPCSGRVDPAWILKALELGIDGVLIVGCRIGECHFRTGNLKAKNRIDSLKEIKEIGERVEYVWLSSGEAEVFAKSVNDFVKKIRELNRAPSVYPL
ncbi:MAG: CoB-CoM heterodisulfide reductase HdrA2 [Archaeoglobaceae archaeon]|nr:CoB-CoM heterodisulfide reductase HdrA2 [Archaeoglobaceae archaeon]MCX8152655.1 CoB-CoM heterodisulfide reductase HdrA2 [Archaeoglobaceae archaeon]MDW8014063.1 CoB-CoM heterodisulfide reductase HdrA2 [Archaeoglobaceae archaeon]